MFCSLASQIWGLPFPTIVVILFFVQFMNFLLRTGYGNLMQIYGKTQYLSFRVVRQGNGSIPGLWILFYLIAQYLWQ